MARRRSNTGRRQSGRNLSPIDSDEDDIEQGTAGRPDIAVPGQAEQAARAAEREAAERQQAAQTVQLSAGISDVINAKVKGLLGGQEALRKIQAMGEDNAQYQNFYENNKASFEKIRNMDLTGTYEALKVNAGNRDQLYKDLVEKNVFSIDELHALQGIVSPQPYLQYIATLRPGERQRQGAVDLTNEDIERLSSVDIDQLDACLTGLKNENKIDNAEERRLREMGPKTPAQLAAAKNEMLKRLEAYDKAAHTSYRSTYKRLDENEERLAGEFDKYIEQYNALVAGLVEQIQREFDENQQNLIKDARTRQLTRETGLPVKKGQILWGLEIVNGQAGTEKNTRVEIQDISFAEVEKDTSLHPDFQILKPTLEPIIHFTTTPNGGQPETLHISATQFSKWLVDNQVTEKFETQDDLEKEIGLVGFIKAGQSFNYLDPDKPAPATPEGGAVDNSNTVTIVKIENGKVYLDHPVRLDPAILGTTISTPRRSDELDFGDFARWYRKYAGVPEVAEMEQLDALLEQHHHKLLAEMGWDEGHGAPISLADGPFPQYLVSAYNPNPELTPIAITGVKDGLIETDSGDKIPPAPFFRAVVENGFTRPTPAQLEELQKIAEAKKNDAAKAKLTTVAASPNNPPDAKAGKAGSEKTVKPSGKSFWERSKEFWGNTQFLSLIEMYELFIKAPKERVKEWLKDKSERRQYAIGKEFYKNFPKLGGLNDLSNTFEDKLNGKNATDVKNAEEFFDKNYTVKQVFDTLYKAPNKNVLKACLQFLSKKGQLRWEDDPKLWAVLNKYLGTAAYYPEKFHHQLGNDRYPVVVGDQDVKKLAPNIDIFDQCRAVIDAGWGTGTYEAISGTNEREYQNKKKETSDKMHAEYEYRGGIGNALKKMLHEWKSGVEVKQAEFDGLLSQAILKTEIPAEQGVFLLVTAFAMKNENGQTILSNSRLNSYIPYLARHQMYFFFASNHPVLDENGNPLKELKDGKPQTTKFVYNNFQEAFRNVMQRDIEAAGGDDYNSYTAGKNTIDWICRKMLTTKLVKDKMQENAGSQDIDVMYYQFLGPLIKQENLDRVIGKSYNSLQKPEVLKNMYAGYNHQLAVKARLLNTGANAAENETRAEEFSDMVNGFIYFNNILKTRIKTRGQYMRMNEALYDTKPLADKERKTIEFCTETEDFMGAFISGVADLSGDAELKEMNQRVTLDKSGVIPDDLEENFRNATRKNILKLSQSKPQALADLARRCAVMMKGMSGKQMTQEEIEKAKTGGGTG